MTCWAALVPRPRANLFPYHGAFAARGCWRVAQATAARADRSAAPPARRSAFGPQGDGGVAGPLTAAALEIKWPTI